MVQDMMYVDQVIKSMGVPMELPMTVEIDNSGDRDLASSWRIGDRTRHFDV